MGFLDFLFSNKKDKEQKGKEQEFRTRETIDTQTLMTSQLAALYLHERNFTYRDIYIQKLAAGGVPLADAQRLFEFECGVMERHAKPYLLEPGFTKNWFFGLKAPFFQVYPKTKADILKERSLTVSELCKLIDEAEWHFWNSHEKNVPGEVWAEICAWRMNGPGAEFAMRYFEMIAAQTGVSMDSIAALSNEQGSHLSRYKWD
ncbi:MAG: hypothetical protein IKU34_08440 [Clostridia bacterium]|nr:hypothetical protein [Clostridia bacterium]